MKELTIQEIETIVKRDENRIMEAKKTTGELAAGMQSGCAFLNTEGGWLFFGIHPQKLTLLGQDVADQTRQDIANAFRKFSPAIDLSAQYIEVPDKPGKFVIAIYFKAPKAFEAPYTYDGRPWYKVENTTAQMPREMFDERIRLSDPEKFSWEKTMLPGATDKDISNKRLVDVINAGINKGRIPASAASLRSVNQRLDHFNLRTAEGYLINAAVALFGKNPTRQISQCELKLARFEGTNMRVFRDQIVCEGNLFDQYDAILDFCRKHMFLSGTMDQKERIDTLTVPYKVIREAALNILIHRTWWSYGAVLSVAIFDDRVEFANPGAFPPGTSPETFYKRPQSKPINKLISEANGYVYLTIRFAKPLTPRLSGDTDNVTDNVTDELTDRQRLIVKLIPFNDTEDVTETTSSLAQKAGVSRRTIARDMEILKEKGYVVRIGPDNGGHWKRLK